LNYGAIERSSAHCSGTCDGGLVGQNLGPLSEDFSTGVGAGGLVGENNEDGTYTGTITNSYSTANAGEGGLVGTQVGGLISASYSTGAVPHYSGGFVCSGGPPYSDDYWDVTTSGTKYGFCDGSNEANVTGLTTKQLRMQLPDGFDPTIWAENPNINNGFPYLIANPPRN
jgi:hypothetical protein